MKPDYLRAATYAAQILLDNLITASPVSPLPILKNIPGVLVFSYDSLSHELSQDRSSVINAFGEKNFDSFTTAIHRGGSVHYVVTYNQHLPQIVIQRSLARELGHIVLGHVGSIPEDIRDEEAKVFSHHLLCPRPLLHMVLSSGIRLTTDVLTNLTGCNDHCLFCMRHIPGVAVPAELNRAVRDNFMDYFRNFYEYQRTASLTDGSALADLGSYMEGYKE